MQIDLSNVAAKCGRKSAIWVSSIEGFEPFEIHLENIEGKRIELTGKTTYHGKYICDRCLCKVERDILISINKSCQIDGERIIDDEEDMNTALADSKLDIADVLFKEAYISAPTKVLCKQDCKGLCPHCGTNLNETECGCNRESLDPRMAKVLDIFSEFKEVKKNVDLS